MKTTTKLILLFIFSISLHNCNNDNDISQQEDINNDPVKFLKKAERYKSGNLFYVTTLNYDSNNKVQSVITVKHNGPLFTSTMLVNYSENSISSIQDILNWVNPNSTDQDITYGVTMDDSIILLTSETKSIEITHTNGYVDSVKEFFTNEPTNYNIMFLTRDINQNLTSTENGSIINNYSDFDTDKIPEPVGQVVDILDRRFINLFNLKVTKNNPKNFVQSISGSIGAIINHTYEYDDLGFVTSIYDGDINSNNYIDYSYLEE